MPTLTKRTKRKRKSSAARKATMNRAHEQGHNKIIQAMRNDPRVLCAYFGGTTNTESEDSYSDVDVFFVANDDAMEALRADVVCLIEQSFPRLLMLACYPPSGPAHNVACNFLFESREIGIGKYDLRIVPASDPFLSGTYAETMRKQVLFDKTGAFSAQLEENQSRIPEYDPSGLRLAVERYWQAVVMQVKFIIRRDPYKLEYVQNGLLQTHVEILRALCPDGIVWDWWARSIREILPEERRRDLLLYLDGLADVGEVGAVADSLMKQFDSDAREACRRWGIEYPENLARAVMRYFREHIGAEAKS